MKVLADRHHAGLFYSLQLLGDRLGWEVYTPIGREWWDEGIWQFGRAYGDERLVAQYLIPQGEAWAGLSGSERVRLRLVAVLADSGAHLAAADLLSLDDDGIALVRDWARALTPAGR